MLRVLSRISKRKMLAYSALIVCVIVATVLVITIPASAEEKLERKIKDQLKGDFEDLGGVVFNNGIDAPPGEKYQSCILVDKDGKEVATTSFDAATGEVNSVYYIDTVRDPGKTNLTIEEVKDIAKEYLETKGRMFGSDYVLVNERLHSDWTDGLNRHFYQYQFEWKKKIGDALTFDTVYMTIDAGNGKVLSWHKVDSNCPPPKTEDVLKPRISKEVALETVYKEIPSIENWWENINIKSEYTLSDELKVEEETTLYYEMFENEPHLTWRVDIIYQYNVTEVAENDVHVTAEDLSFEKRFTYVIDARNGEVLYINEYQDI